MMNQAKKLRADTAASGDATRRDAGVWVGRVPWTYVHGYLREVAERLGECRLSHGRRIRVAKGFLRLWRQAVATPMGGRSAIGRLP